MSTAAPANTPALKTFQPSPFFLRALGSLAIVVSLLSFESAHAVITITGQGGFTEFQAGVTTAATTTGGTATAAVTTPPKFFVGTAGLDSGGACAAPSTLNADGVSCNTCQAGTLTACNPNAALASKLIFTITMTTDQKGPAYPGVIVSTATGATTAAITPSSISPNSVTDANQPVTFTIPWSQICGNIVNANSVGSASLCLADGMVTLTFFFGTTPGSTTQSGDSIQINFVVQNSAYDTVATTTNPSPTCGGAATCGSSSSNEGIDTFNLTDGDAKVYVGNANSQSGSFPTRANPNLYFKTARFYYVEINADPSQSPLGNGCDLTAGNPNVTAIRNNSTLYVDNPINPPVTVAGTATSANVGTLSNEYLSGPFQNQHAYAFKVALIDQADNIGFFTADSDCGDYAYSVDHGGTPIIPNGNHVAHPSPVEGLLSKPLNCFVATAAFGSALDPFVKVLRLFRDQFLLTSANGSRFVKWYYANSPGPALWISEHPLAKRATQVALWPAVGFAWASVNYGMPAAWVLSIFTVLILFLIVRQFFRFIFGFSRFAIWLIILGVLGSSLFLLSIKSEAQTTRTRLPAAGPSNATSAPADTAPQEAPYIQPQDDDAQVSKVNPTPNAAASGQSTTRPGSPPPTVNSWKEWKDPFAGKSKAPSAVQGGTEWRNWNDPFQKKLKATEPSQTIPVPPTGQASGAKSWKDWSDPFANEKPNDPSTQYPNNLATKPSVLNQSAKTPSELTREKGVQRITKEGEFIYGLPQPHSDHAATFRVGTFSPANLQNHDTGIPFSEIYGSGGTALFLDYQWFLTKRFGTLGFKVGSGLVMAQGHGIFVPEAIQIPRPNGNVAQELYTFALFPNTAALIYRFKYYDKQFIVPYIEGGADYYTFAEIRDDGITPKIGGSALAHGAAGIAFMLDGLSPKSMLDLDRDYGISHVYLTAEYRLTQSLEPENLDFSASGVLVGFAVDF